jgi:hypothetical protein
MNRRNLLKQRSLSVGATVLGSNTMARLANDAIEYEIPANPLHKRIDKPVTAITLGAGNRGNVYGNFAEKFPNLLDIIGVAEPIPIRNERYATKHKIEAANRFDTWERVLRSPNLQMPSSSLRPMPCTMRPV